MRLHSDSLQQWYQQAPGNWLLQLEQEQVDKWLPDRLTGTCLQLGGLPDSFIANDRQSGNTYFMSPDADDRAGQIAVFGDYGDLPFQTESLDLVLLIHVLEFCDQPLQLLEETFRMLAPNGKLLVIAFNAWSVWGMRALSAKNNDYPWYGKFISPVKLQYWVKKAGYATLKDKTFCFRSAFIQRPLKKTSLFLEALGQIATPMLGAVNIFLLEKQVYGTIAGKAYQQALIESSQVCK